VGPPQATGPEQLLRGTHYWRRLIDRWPAGAEVVVSSGSGALNGCWQRISRLLSASTTTLLAPHLILPMLGFAFCLRSAQMTGLWWLIRRTMQHTRLLLLLCWPQLQPSTFESYMTALASTPAKLVGLLIVAGENCSPQDPRVAATAARCGNAPGSWW